MKPSQAVWLILVLAITIIAFTFWDKQIQTNRPAPTKITIHVHGQYGMVVIDKDGQFVGLGETEVKEEEE